MALGFGAGLGAGAAAASLTDILKQRFVEQLQKQKLAEDIRQADLQNQVQQAQLGQGQQRIGLEGQKLGEDRRQFDVSSGQTGQRLGMEQTRLGMDQEVQPLKMKQIAAQTEDLNRQPQEALDTRAFREKELGLEHQNRLGEIGATTAGALRVAQARPPALMTVFGGYDEQGQPIQKVVPKVEGATSVKPDVQTQQTRQMGETAKVILPHIAQVRDEAQQLDKLGLLGPVSGRWRDFVAGKVGAGELAGGNPENARLIGQFQANIMLLQTAVARAHAGARGAGNVTLLQHMEKIMPGTAADLPTLMGSLDAVGGWMQTYADDISHGQTPPSAGPQGTTAPAKPEFDWVPGKGLVPRGGG